MLILPAIDLKDGEAVRLYKGDYNNKKVYSKEPEKLAVQFEQMGAKIIHLVDLDGAKNGYCANYETIKKIREAVSIKIELGGGIRDKKTVDMYLNELKIDRIILGTAAITNFSFLKEILNGYGSEKIVVGVDIKDNLVSTSGWTKTTNVNYIDFIKELEKIGIKYIIVTDISKDGTLSGPNFELYKKIKENTNINFIVSGGIKNKEDVLKVANLNYYGCIIGKAYYDGKVDLMEVLNA